MPLRPSGRRYPDQPSGFVDCELSIADFRITASSSRALFADWLLNISRGSIGRRARMKIQRARSLVEITREIVEMHPGATCDRLSRVSDANAKFHDGLASDNIPQGNFMS